MSSRSASGRSSSQAHFRLGSTRARARSPGSASASRSISPASIYSTRRAEGRSLRAELSRHAVRFEVLLVEFPPEPGCVAQLDRAAFEPWPIGDEVPPDRVAVGMEALDERS